MLPVHDRAAVDRALEFPALIEALRQGFVAGCEAPVRHHHAVPRTDAPDATLLLMPAWQQDQRLGVKIVQVSPGNEARGLPTVDGLYLLFDATTGTPLAVMDGKAITERRTAAASALAALGHLAEGRGVDGGRNVGVNLLGGREDRDLRQLDADGAGDIYGVLGDPALGGEVGGDVDAAIADDEGSGIGRGQQDEDMAHATVGAQAGGTVDNLGHELICVQRALHDRTGLSGPDESDGLGSGGVAVGHINEGDAGEVRADPGGGGFDLLLRADKDGLDQAGVAGIQRAFQRSGAHGVCDSGAKGRKVRSLQPCRQIGFACRLACFRHAVCPLQAGL